MTRTRSQRPEGAPGLRPDDQPSSRAFALLNGLTSHATAVTDRDARRVGLGIGVLVVLVLALLNVAIFRGTRTHLVEEQSRLLTHHAEQVREEVRAVVARLASSAEFAAQSEHFAAIAAADPGATDPSSGLELNRIADHFHFHSVRVVRRDGLILSQSQGSAPRDFAYEQSVVSRALAAAKTTVVAGRPSGAAGPVLTFAVPVPGHAENVAAVFDAAIEVHVQPILDRMATKPGWGAFLVMERISGVLLMSAPGEGVKAETDGSLSLDDPRYDPASNAAGHVESTLEGPNGQWSITRRIPELGLGLVAHADSDAMLSGTRIALVGLLVLDFGMLVVLAGFLWVWRRQYHGQLDQQQQQQARRHSENISAVVDNAFDAILIFDCDGRVQMVNHAAERLFQRSVDEMVGAPSHQFLEWNTAGRPGTIEALAIGRVSRTEIVRSDGKLVPVEFSLGFSGTGANLLYTAIIRDISERVEAEDQIRNIAQGLEVSNRRLQEVNAQLEEASRLKSEFLANTSHELRTPLNGIIGFLQLVLDGMCDTRAEERDFQTQALQCSRHLLGLINDVLDIAKIEAGKLSLESAPVDVMALFNEVHTLTHVQAAQKGVALKFTVSQADLPAARGDFGKIKQVLVNLVGNSIKFTVKGSITVSARVHPELGHVMFEVADTGVGIPKDRQKMIFEKFTQADGSTTRRFGGTGLGLAICRSLVELMGGVIGVDSEGEGKGTRMHFSLPIWRGQEDEQVDGELVEERILGPSGGAVLLVVEDDSVFRKFLSALLHRHGYRTVEAASADAGWVLARRLRPAAVLVDYALVSAEGAGMRTGWDLARRMAEEPSTRRIPLVFVTGFGDELRDKLTDTAFARRPEYLPKPVDARDLLKRIEKILGPSADRVLRILLADDDPAVAAYLRKVLPETRYQMEVVNDGDECLHALRTQPQGFDLLLLDLMMPNASGYDVLRQMTLTGAGSQLPVLVLTNCPEPQTEEERRLLETGTVLEVVAKGAIHADHALLPKIIEGLGLARAGDWPVEGENEREAA